jgi:hypothetical protein
MFDPEKLRIGTVVRSADGEKLGKIHSIGITRFEVEKGIFFKEDFLAGYEDIQEIRNGEVILRHDTENLRNRAELEGEEALVETLHHTHSPRIIDTIASDEGFDPQPGSVHIRKD